MKPIDHESALPIWLITDASDTGVRAWVGEGETADTGRPAALLSRKFSNAQMHYGITDKEALAIVDALTAYHYLLAGNEFTIVTDHQPLMYLKTSRTPTKKQLSWRGYIGQFRTKIIYRPGQWNYLADALSRLYTEDKSYPHTVQDATQEDSESDTSPLTHFTETDPEDMSRFEVLEVNYNHNHSDCSSNCSIHRAALDPSNYRNKDPINNWGDYHSISSGRSDEEIAHSAQHWSDCFVLICPVHEDDKIRNKVYAGELSSSPPIDNPQQGAMQDPMDLENNEETILSPRPRPDLSKIKRRLHEALGCTTTNIPCESPGCPVHHAPRPSPTKPLYGGPLASHNIIPVIEPPKLPHHNGNLYQLYNDIAEEEESEVIRWERIVDERDVVQVMNEMETIWREQIIKGYRNDPVYQLAQDSSNTSRGEKMEYYRIRNYLLYATTRGGEDCLYIPKGHEINGETLRELMISEIHTKGHHSADRNLRYASEYIYWPEMRKDFRDFVRQCELCQANKERNTLPTGDAQTLPFPSEIFSSYAIDFMGPFTKLKGQDSVLVVVDRAVGFSWLIPTSVTATAVQTTELLQHHIFTPHGVPTSIVSDANPRFTSKF